MSVNLRKKINRMKVNGRWIPTGTISLYLDINEPGTKRRAEFLHHLKLTKASNPLDRQRNKENLQLAKTIAVKRAQEISANGFNVVSENAKKAIVTDWMQKYIDGYKKKDKRNLQGALNRFKDFLIEEKKQGLTFGTMTSLGEDLMKDFRDYLSNHSKGEGAASYWARFKKMVKHAYSKKIIRDNPTQLVKRPKGAARKKDILTMEEIQVLAKTKIESPEVRRAALFCLVTGLRWVDVKNLYWSNINIKNKLLKKEQTKVEGEFKEVSINLNHTAIQLIGKPGTPEELIFDLPSANGANKTLKQWVKRADIQKKLTWHGLRHSFGTNLIFNGADVKTASSLLGHSTLRHTERYLREANQLKEKATDKLNVEV